MEGTSCFSVLSLAVQVKFGAYFAAHLSIFSNISFSYRGEDVPVASDQRGEEAQAILHSTSSSHTQREEIKVLIDDCGVLSRAGMAQQCILLHFQHCPRVCLRQWNPSLGWKCCALPQKKK